MMLEILKSSDVFFLTEKQINAITPPATATDLSDNNSKGNVTYSTFGFSYPKAFPLFVAVISIIW
jgi:hypothetical protein